jgi:signal transduction histidine kinase
VRRRLILVSGAVTAMVVLAFLLPLSLMIRDLAADRAVTTGQNQAEEIAQLAALLARGSDARTVANSINADLYTYPTSIITAEANGSFDTIGEPVPANENIDAALGGASFRAAVTGGQAVYASVVLPNTDEKLVARVFISDAALTEGVTRSTAILAMLGAALVLIAVAVADRLGRSLVQPVRDLSATAASLGEGNLETRVTPSGPPELQEVGRELNDLADRIVRLLRMEREAAADLSHRLRTPLTALRLDAEALEPGPGSARLLEDLDELERTVDFVIREARRPGRTDAAEACDLGEVAADRVRFWTALAEEQEREVEYISDGSPVEVGIGSDDATAMVDALIGNVFAHTDEGVGFTVAVAALDGEAILVVDDHGPGFTAELAERGRSTGGSTGLGLDIAMRTADAAGGALIIGASDSGGARVTVTLPLAP